MGSFFILFVAVHGNANDYGANQVILNGQSIDLELSALLIFIAVIQRGQNAILRAQTLQ